MRHGLAVVCLILPLAMVGTARSDDVIIEVTTLKAKARGRSDRSLRRLRSQLRRVSGYRSYRIVAAERRDCAWARQQEFRLPGGRSLYLMPKGVASERVLMRVRLLEGTEALVDTDVRFANDGTMFLGLERNARSRDGALLIMLKAGVR
jgi:hypothetical protein